MREWNPEMRLAETGCVSSGVVHSVPLRRTIATLYANTPRCGSSGSSGSGATRADMKSATSRLPQTTWQGGDSSRAWGSGDERLRCMCSSRERNRASPRTM